jgi:hypothetical protein
MTAVAIPDFIMNMYENECRKLVHQVVHIISNRFELNADKVRKCVERELDVKLQLVPECTETVKITRVKPRKLPDDEVRCIARIHRNDAYERCPFHVFVPKASKPKKNQVMTKSEVTAIMATTENNTLTNCFCKHHMTKSLRWGVIHDPEPPLPIIKHHNVY